jgi:hypothetical protein
LANVDRFFAAARRGQEQRHAAAVIREMLRAHQERSVT